MMIKVVFILSSITIVESSVVIKLGSYSNRANLANQISNLRYGLNNRVSIVEESDMFRAYSYEFDTKEEALEKLNIYKEIFPDAYIMQSKKTSSSTPREAIIINSPKNTPTNTPTNTVTNQTTNQTTNKPTEEDIKLVNMNTTTPIIKKNIELIGIKHSDKVITPISKEREDLSIYSVLGGNKFYICPHNIKTKSQKILIEVDFTEDNIVKYKTIVGKIPAMTISYIIRGDKLYFTRGGRVNPYQYSVLEDKFFDYYVISQWSKGKNINRMRYYPKEENAKSYLNSLQF